uniref:Non-specific serine/threonine protein kinase n=1 Tax=Rhizophora mucronata TaxID=61149 RepID=A0A2P2LIS7_RHIMU
MFSLHICFIFGTDFGQMTSLKVLSLTSNNLNGSLTQEGSC